nr:L,D-transpeptidase [Patulibacter sp. SYSU D01012]
MIAPAAAASSAGADAADPLAPTARAAHVAHVVVATAVRSAPGGGRPRGRVGTTAPWGGGPVRLLVLASAADDRGVRWLRVRLPERPNDRDGWIREHHVRLGVTRWRLVVAVRRRTLEARHDGRVVRRFRVVVGAPGTPTPTGRFAVAERIRQSSGSELGSWALHLTAHSDVLDDYGGGPGRVAIHGRAGALLRDPLGTARSHGCVRMDDAAVRWLAARAREGTPVDVRR